MKKSFILATVLAGTFTVFGVHNVAEATSELESERENVQDQREEVQSELSEAEQELADLTAEIQDIENLIANIEEGLQANQEKIDQTEEEIAENEAHIKELEEEIEILEADIEERFNLLKDRASSYQRNGGPTSSYIEVILGAEGFGDFIGRVLTISQIAKADNEFIEDLERKQDELNDVQSEFEETLESLDDQMTELEGIEFYMEEQRDEQNELRAEVEEHTAEQESMIADLESQESELASEEASLADRIDAELERQREAEREAAASQASNTSNNTSNTSTSNGGNSGGSSSGQATSNNSSGGSGGGATGSASAVINAGTHYIGNSTYVFGGGRSNNDIQNGRFDCSGYVSWAFSQIGVSLPASTDAMLHSGRRISASEKRPGDLVFFDTYKRNGHVAIYAGNGRFIGSQSSTGVAYASMTSGYWANNFRGVVVRVLN